MPADFDISPVIPPTPGVPPPPSSDKSPSIVPAPMPKKRTSNQVLKALVLVAVGLFVVTLGVLYWGNGSFSASGVVLELKAVDHATSGDAVTYTVKYRNDTKIPLTKMSFRLFYPPKSVVIKDGQPTTPESDAFTVDQLDPGQSGEKEFTIYMVGDKGTLQTAHVRVIFRAGNLASSFEKDASTVTTITALPVTLTLVAPPTSVSGQPVQYILDIRNDSTQDMADLRAVFTYPEGFTVQRMSPQAEEGNTVWRVKQLRVGQGTRITVDGTLNGNEREAKKVAVALQHNINGQYVDYVNTDSTTIISSPLLSTSISVNDGRNYVSHAGDTLRYRVSYANNSSFSLIGLVLKVTLEGDMYDFTQLRTGNGSFDDSSKTLTFDSAGVSDFSNLRPGQRGELSFDLPLKSSLTGAPGTKNFSVKATSKLSTTNIPSGLDGSEVFATDSLTTKISSQPSMTHVLLYDSGAGSGPVPPQVGQETILTVQWQLTNPGNDIKNAKVVATLAPGVTFKGNATASTGVVPTFNSASNQVTWNIGTLFFSTGTSGIPRAQGQFQVSIKPSSNQQGQAVSILNSSTFTGADSFTNQDVQVLLPTLNTNAISGHSGQGTVQ